MRVLVTGASGHIGSATIPELLAAGHQVVGLARSDRSAAAVEALGAEVVRGDLTDPDTIAAHAASAEGVIHLAYDHSFTDFAAAAASDLRVIEAVGAALEGSGKPFVTTGGTLMLVRVAAGRVGTEEMVGEAGPRIDSENATVALAARGVRSSVVRLAPMVHSDLDHEGFLPRLIAVARDSKMSGYVGDGSNRWPGLNTRDAAVLYRLALESAPAGTRLHGVEGDAVPFVEIAEHIGHQLGVPAVAIEPEEAAERFGFLGAMVGLDNPVSNQLTREVLGWEPTHPGLLADIDAGHYFA